MSLLKFGEAVQFNQDNFISYESIKADKEIHDRFTKLAANLKTIAPKAEDFLYFTAIMMHAAERSTIDEDGKPLFDKKGNIVTAKWKIDDKTGSWLWDCSDPSIKPYKNCNGDIFPESELKIAYRKWVGKPLCQDHISNSMDGVRGLIVDTYWDDKYKRIIALCALDKVNHAKLARDVQTGVANCVSMGVGVGKSICSECGNVARTESEYCTHVRTHNAYGEVNIDLAPIELSLVVNGADTKAKVLEVLAAAKQLENNINQASESSNIVSLAKVFQEEFSKLATRIKNIEDELSLRNTNDNNLTLRTAAFNISDSSADLELIKQKMSNIEYMLQSFAEKFNTEDLMGKAMDKKGYFQGTEEPTPGKPQYEKEEADKIRNEQDSHMKLPLTDLGPVDGIPASDLAIKQKLSRAAIDERRALRAAAVEKAQQTIKQAYPQGTGELPKGGYPKDPGAKVRDTEFTYNKGNGTDGLFDNDEKVKKELHRASMKAKLVKGATVDDNRWNIVTDSNELVLSASFKEILKKNPALNYETIADSKFAQDMMKKIRTYGANRTANMYKSAQEMPAAEPAMPAMPTEPAPEMANAPAGEMPTEPAMPAEEGKPVTVSPDTVKELEDASKALSKAVKEMGAGSEAMKEEEKELPELPADASKATDEALAALSTEAPTTPAKAEAALTTLRMVINAGLKKKFNKNIKNIKNAKEEIDLLISLAGQNNVDPQLFDNMSKDSLNDVAKVLAKSKVLKGAFVRYAKGTYALEKKAAMNRQFTKQAQMAKKPEMGEQGEDVDVEKEDKDMKPETSKPTTTPTVASSEFDMSTVEGRRAYRRKLAATIETKCKCSDMIGKAHPKSDTKLGDIANTNEAVVEGIDTVHEKIMETVSHEPKVSKKVVANAEALNTLVKAGKVNPANLDEMVKNGFDKDVANYWKKYYGQVEGGSEFAAALLKDYSDSKSSVKSAEAVENYKAKYAKAYDLAYSMADVGLICKNNTAIKAEAEKIVNYDDNAYSSLKNVVARHIANMPKTAAIQVGVALDDGNSAATRSEGSLYEELSRSFGEFYRK